MKPLFLALAFAAALPAAVLADTSSAHAQRRGTTQEDWHFMRQAAAAERAEVAAGQLAAARASDPAVRAVGKELMQEQQAASRHLALLALDTQIPLPARPAKGDRKQLDRLKALKGEAFDRAFLAQFGIAVQADMVTLFRREAQSKTLYPALRHYAQETLPVLEHGLQEARRVQAQAAESHGAAAAAARNS